MLNPEMYCTLHSIVSEVQVLPATLPQNFCILFPVPLMLRKMAPLISSIFPIEKPAGSEKQKKVHRFSQLHLLLFHIF
jgi:hypothetical protein